MYDTVPIPVLFRFNGLDIEEIQPYAYFRAANQPCGVIFFTRMKLCIYVI